MKPKHISRLRNSSKKTAHFKFKEFNLIELSFFILSVIKSETKKRKDGWQFSIIELSEKIKQHQRHPEELSIHNINIPVKHLKTIIEKMYGFERQQLIISGKPTLYSFGFKQ